MLFDVFIALIWFTTSYLFQNPSYTLRAAVVMLGLGLLSTRRSRS